MASHRHYLVKTKSGRIIVSNCRFLRLASIGEPGGDCGMLESLVTVPKVEPRRSTREKQTPQRVSLDPRWLLSSLVQSPEELEGEM